MQRLLLKSLQTSTLKALIDFGLAQKCPPESLKEILLDKFVFFSPAWSFIRLNVREYERAHSGETTELIKI